MLGHSWDLAIIQPRLRMTENRCNPAATWPGLENGLKWPLFFPFRADRMDVRKAVKLFQGALMLCREVLGPISECIIARRKGGSSF